MADDIGHPFDAILFSRPVAQQEASNAQICLKGLQITLWMSQLRGKFYNPSTTMYGDRLLLELLHSRRALGSSDPQGIVFAHVLIARSVYVVW